MGDHSQSSLQILVINCIVNCAHFRLIVEKFAFHGQKLRDDIWPVFHCGQMESSVLQHFFVSVDFEMLKDLLTPSLSSWSKRWECTDKSSSMVCVYPFIAAKCSGFLPWWSLCSNAPLLSNNCTTLVCPYLNKTHKNTNIWAKSYMPVARQCVKESSQLHRFHWWWSCPFPSPAAVWLCCIAHILGENQSLVWNLFPRKTFDFTWQQNAKGFRCCCFSG